MKKLILKSEIADRQAEAVELYKVLRRSGLSHDEAIKSLVVKLMEYLSIAA